MDHDANSAPVAVQVYLRVVEGKNLKAVESNGTSDPLFQIYVDGKSRKLESSHVVGTTAPTWPQEFVLGLQSSHSILQLRLLDWNRFSSNKSLGNVDVDLSKLRIGTFYDDWRAADTQGELRVLIHLSRLNMPSPQSLNMKLPKTRIHLERADYYPGDTIRGCVVFRASKKTTVAFIRFIIEGATSSAAPCCTGQCVLFGRKVQFLGTIGDNTATKLKPGLYLYPFECTLPLNLPHTYDSGGVDGRPGSIGANVNKYRLIMFSYVHEEGERKATTDFRVLAHPMHATLDPRSITFETSSKSAPVIIDVDGPPVAWCAENFSLNVKIQNNGNAPISHLVVRLKVANWINGRAYDRPWHRKGGEWIKVEDVKVTDLPGFPIAPGQAWSGAVRFPIPANLNPTMNSTVSPLLQNGYHLIVKPITSDDKALKASGSNKHGICIWDRYSALDHLEVPVDAVGAVGVIMTAPAPPHLNAALVPLPQTKDGALEYYGGSYGSVAAYPGAVQPQQFPHPIRIYESSLPAELYPKDAEWTPGREPSWLVSGCKGS